MARIKVPLHTIALDNPTDEAKEMFRRQQPSQADLLKATLADDAPTLLRAERDSGPLSSADPQMWQTRVGPQCE